MQQSGRVREAGREFAPNQVDFFGRKPTEALIVQKTHLLNAQGVFLAAKTIQHRRKRALLTGGILKAGSQHAPGIGLVRFQSLDDRGR